jgi:hypothetical protein
LNFFDVMELVSGWLMVVQQGASSLRQSANLGISYVRIGNTRRR